MSIQGNARTALCCFAVFACAVLTSCVPNRPYRLGQHYPGLSFPDELADVECKANAAAPAFCAEHPRAARYDLAFVEFDDMGELWTIGDLKYDGGKPKNTQVDHAIEVIQQRRAENPNVTVVTFIHGWKNNASPYDERHDKSLSGFRVWMEQLAEEDPKTSFVGVFMAWRGQSLPADPFFSYWDRRDASMRVARASMTEALFRLMLATKDHITLTESNQCGNSLPESDSRFVVIGHSFGGRILEHALSQPLLALLLESRA